MTALGATSLPVLAIQHPLGGEGLDGVGQRVAQAIEQLSGLLAAGGRRTPDQRAEHVRSADDRNGAGTNARVFAGRLKRSSGRIPKRGPGVG